MLLLLLRRCSNEGYNVNEGCGDSPINDFCLSTINAEPILRSVSNELDRFPNLIWERSLILVFSVNILFVSVVFLNLLFVLLSFTAFDSEST